MKTIQAIVAENIKERMKELGMTQKDLARDLKITQPQVSKWVSGETMPEPESQTRLCKALNCSIDRLIRVNKSDILENSLSTIMNRLESIENQLKPKSEGDLEGYDIKALADVIKKRAEAMGVSSYEILKSELAPDEKQAHPAQKQTNQAQKKAP